jgi:hypothetical protein
MSQEKEAYNKRKEYKKRYCAKLRKEKPWYGRYWNITYRCKNPKSLYARLGIKNLLSRKDLEFLWFRDKAYNLKAPQLHRIDNRGDYSLKNCKFVSRVENIKERNKYYRERGLGKCSSCDRFKEVFNEGYNSAIKRFKEEVVPKEKETNPSTEADEISFLEDVETMGYNQAIKDILERLG